MLCTTIVKSSLSFFSILAVILNLTLLPLIATKSGTEIGSYKVLLFLYTLIAFIYTFISLLMVPVFEPSEKGWLFYATEQRIPRELGSYVICVFCACYIKLLLVLTYSFVYRLFVLSAPFHLRWFHEPRRIISIVLLYLLILSVCAAPVFAYMRLNEEIAENFEKDPTGAHIQLRNVSYIGAPMFREGHLVGETTAIMVIWTVVMLTSTSLSTFCIVKISLVFRNAAQIAQMSETSRRVQRKLFTLLILQTLVPVCFTFLPGLLSYALAIGGTHAPAISQTASALLPLAQVIDPILIFYMISEYRRNLLYCCLRHIFRTRISSSFVRESGNSVQPNGPNTTTAPTIMLPI